MSRINKEKRGKQGLLTDVKKGKLVNKEELEATVQSKNRLS